MWFVTGSLVGGTVGFLLGFVLAMAGQVALEKKAVEDGYVKLGGKMYTIAELDISKKE